jgi:flagellar motor switch protein FliG
LLSLPDAEAASLLRSLEFGQIEAVARQIAQLVTVDGDEQRTALCQFAGDSSIRCREARGGIARAETLVRSALGTAADSLLARLRGTTGGDPLSIVAQFDNRALAGLLAQEHPQTVAVVLSQLPARRVAEILISFAPELRLGIIHRIATIGEPNPAAIRDIASVLAARTARAPRSEPTSWPLPLAS